MIPLSMRLPTAFILSWNFGYVIIGYWWKAELIMLLMVSGSVVTFLSSMQGFPFRWVTMIDVSIGSMCLIWFCSVIVYSS